MCGFCGSLPLSLPPYKVVDGQSRPWHLRSTTFNVNVARRVALLPVRSSSGAWRRWQCHNQSHLLNDVSSTWARPPHRACSIVRYSERRFLPLQWPLIAERECPPGWIEHLSQLTSSHVVHRRQQGVHTCGRSYNLLIVMDWLLLFFPFFFLAKLKDAFFEPKPILCFTITIK